jgi:hypothetical protein
MSTSFHGAFAGERRESKGNANRRVQTEEQETSRNAEIGKPSHQGWFSEVTAAETGIPGNENGASAPPADH